MTKLGQFANPRNGTINSLLFYFRYDTYSLPKIRIYKRTKKNKIPITQLKGNHHEHLDMHFCCFALASFFEFIKTGYNSFVSSIFFTYRISPTSWHVSILLQHDTLTDSQYSKKWTYCNLTICPTFLLLDYLDFPPILPIICSISMNIFFFFKKTFTVVDTQCCANFRCTAKWISFYIHTYAFFNILFPYKPLQGIK